ncbi:O-antigen ligase family protein [Roseateles sp. MS654]|uniref:O-antigen ligase family protein n=1 Tax=Roseateles sp. MS654 TaxID=3412685 RepID=UPI003C2F9791
MSAPIPKRRRSHGTPPAVAPGIALLSWTFPRIGPFKFTEVLALLSLPRALQSPRTLQRVLNCYGFFILATILACIPALFTLGTGDNTITSDKGLYSSPESAVVMTVVRMVAYLLVVVGMTHFFRTVSDGLMRRTLDWCYALALLPGLLQMLRMYSGIYFDLPYLERAGLGPFSGVYDSGYLRLMGFEFEPLGYGTSLMVVCCLRIFARNRWPLLGLVVLAHTFSAGAIVASAAALLLGYPTWLRRYVTPLYALLFLALSAVVWTYLDELLTLLTFQRSAAERINALGICINMWLDHPFGVGPGLYGYFMNFYDRANFPAPQLDWYPNNDPAMFLAYGGVLYLLAYLWVFHYALMSTPSRWIRVALIGLLVQSISSYMFFNPAAAVIIAVALSGRLPPAPVLRKKQRQTRRQSESPSAPIAA